MFDATPFSEEEFALNDLNRMRAHDACPYFNGVGACAGASSCGYFGEPVCITNNPGPWGLGWKTEIAKAARYLAEVSRGKHGRVKYARDIMRQAEKAIVK